MKINYIVLTFCLAIGISFSTISEAKDNRVRNAIDVFNDITTLADEFNLTPVQKAEMKSVLIDYLPKIAMKANSMLNNRQELLLLTTKTDEFDEEFIVEIAGKQAQLLKSLIIQKEHMKKELRVILTEEQKGFIDAMIDAIIQHRINNIS